MAEYEYEKTGIAVERSISVGVISEECHELFLVGK